MANFEGSYTTNFGSAVTGQTNTFWVPEIFSNKVQVAFRKSSVAEAICNTDYFGEISSYGDTVNIIKEPTISVNDYTRGLDTTASALTDQELVMVIDQAKYFHFEVDDLEERFSHVNWQQVAADNAAYQLRNAYDNDVLSYIGTYATAVTNIGGTNGTTAAPIDLGHGTSDIDPLDVLARLARTLDDNDVPEENRYVVAEPVFYEELAQTSSKLMSIDYNQGDGGLRNGLVASGQLRGFYMYKSTQSGMGIAGTGSYSGSTLNQIYAGHMSAVAAASALSQTESFRSPTTFADVVRGMLVWGRKILRDDAILKAIYTTDND